MKRNSKTILSLIIATFLLFLGNFGINYYLKTTSDNMLNVLSKVEDNLKSKNLEEAEALSIDLNDKWKDIEKKWTLLTNHHEIDNITTSLKNMVEFIRFKDLPNSMSSLVALKHYIEHIPSMENLNLRNIL